MSFRGRPSRGCAKCRSRKVKCDEALPACRRCVKGGFDCQYRDSFDLFFRNQTSEVAQKAQEKWRSRAKKPSDSSISPISDTGSEFSFPDLDCKPNTSLVKGTSSPITYVAAQPLLSPSIPQQLSLVPFRTSQAYNRFFFDFCVPSEAPNKAGLMFGFLPDLLKTVSPDSVLHNALGAAAFANFAGRYGSQEALLSGAEQYGKTLKKLANSMNDPRKTSTPETLVAMCVLGIYELVTSKDMDKIASWTAHTNGAAALMHIKSCQEKSPSDPMLAGIYSWIFSQILIKCLSDGTIPKMPLPTQDALTGLDQYSYRLLVAMYNTAVFCGTWKLKSLEFLTTHTYDPSVIEALIAEGQKLDQQLQNYADSLPEPLCYTKVLTSTVQQVHWLRPLLRAPGAPQYLHRYKDFSIAAGWNSYRTTRLVLNGNLLEMCKSLQDVCGTDTSLTYRTAEHRVRFCTDEICEGTIACFADRQSAQPVIDSTLELPGMRGYAILWPLFMAGMYITWAGDRKLDVNMRSQWIRQALGFIENNLGIQKAAAFLDTINNGVPSWYDTARKVLTEGGQPQASVSSPPYVGSPMSYTSPPTYTSPTNYTSPTSTMSPVTVITPSASVHEPFQFSEVICQ